MIATIRQSVALLVVAVVVLALFNFMDDEDLSEEDDDIHHRDRFITIEFLTMPATKGGPSPRFSAIGMIGVTDFNIADAGNGHLKTGTGRVGETASASMIYTPTSPLGTLRCRIFQGVGRNRIDITNGDSGPLPPGGTRSGAGAVWNCFALIGP